MNRLILAAAMVVLSESAQAWCPWPMLCVPENAVTVVQETPTPNAVQITPGTSASGVSITFAGPTNSERMVFWREVNQEREGGAGLPTVEIITETGEIITETGTYSHVPEARVMAAIPPFKLLGRNSAGLTVVVVAGLTREECDRLAEQVKPQSIVVPTSGITQTECVQ